MRINFFSDLHLEFGGLEFPDSNADVVVAAGDIGTHLIGIEWLKKLNKPVFYVAGNHEFYGSDYRHKLLQLQLASRGSQVTFLENSSVIYQGIRFLGCTLWADLEAASNDKKLLLAKALNDFKKIDFDERRFQLNDFSYLHQSSRNWLELELAKPFNGKTVVITHHAPTEWSWNRPPNAAKKLAYCNDMKYLMYEYDIVAWFHGHIHNYADYRIADSMVLCNPRGYYPKKLVKEFDLNRVVNI